MKSLCESILSKHGVSPDSIIAADLTQKMGEMGCGSGYSRTGAVSVDSKTNTVHIVNVDHIMAEFIEYCSFLKLNNVDIISNNKNSVVLECRPGIAHGSGDKLQNINIHNNYKLDLYLREAVLEDCQINAPEIYIRDDRVAFCANCVLIAPQQLHIILSKKHPQTSFDKCTIKSPYISWEDCDYRYPVFKQHLVDLGLLIKQGSKFEKPEYLDKQYNFTLQDILSPVFTNFKWSPGLSGKMEFYFNQYSDVYGTSLQRKSLILSKQNKTQSKTVDNYYISIE